jgi:hypothetical protein
MLHGTAYRNYQEKMDEMENPKIRYPWNCPGDGAKNWKERDYFKKLVRDLKYIPTIWEWAGYNKADAIKKNNMPIEQWQRFSYWLQVNGYP